MGRGGEHSEGHRSLQERPAGKDYYITIYIKFIVYACLYTKHHIHTISHAYAGLHISYHTLHIHVLHFSTVHLLSHTIHLTLCTTL